MQILHCRSCVFFQIYDRKSIKRAINSCNRSASEFGCFKSDSNLYFESHFGYRFFSYFFSFTRAHSLLHFVSFRVIYIMLVRISIKVHSEFRPRGERAPNMIITWSRVVIFTILNVVVFLHAVISFCTEIIHLHAVIQMREAECRCINEFVYILSNNFFCVRKAHTFKALHCLFFQMVIYCL